ncbi:MAG: protein translocase subunit SecF [Thermoanaerobaculia bacterium]
MDLLRNTNIDFMKYRKFWVAISFLTILMGAVFVFVHGKLNIGIDFAGGTQLTLKFRERPDVQQVRQLLTAAGIEDTQIQRFGAVEDNEIMVRTPIVAGSEEGRGTQVVGVLSSHFNPDAKGVDLNQVGTGTVTDLLVKLNPDGLAETADEAAAAAHYGAIAESILASRKGSGLFTGWDAIAASPGVTARTLESLKTGASVGSFSVLSTENVGPQVGSELRQRGLLAVVGALLGMLVYIWIRFELRFGIGATMASVHDVLVTLGLYAVAGYEFNLTTIAAFLTLVGYSVNDTVVTFDRVRENMAKSKSENLVSIMNKSINQTLSRTILTGGTTILASLTLLIFGGDVIRGFAFIMTVGVIVGTYSSMYIASPFALLWEQWFGAAGKRSKSAGKPAKTGAAKPAPGNAPAKSR